tara:strand:- start:647 stop:1405 length:759 start_codon:yes stop_codon:yes gene_type:complete
MSLEIFIAAPFGNYIRHPEAISVTGTWTLNPRGNRFKSIIKTLRYDRKEKGWVNRLGLPNPGLKVGLDKTWSNQILSIAETSEDEFLIMEDMIPNTMNVEVNLSCPNLPESTAPKLIDNDSPMIFTALSMESNHSPKLVGRKWCIAKVSPFITGEELHHVIDKLNFKQIHFANTIPTKKGGLSGPSLKPYVLQLIHYVRGIWGDAITIIAGGGIKTKNDISEYINEGANHVSLGTVCFNPIRLRKLLNFTTR